MHAYVARNGRGQGVTPSLSPFLWIVFRRTRWIQKPEALHFRSFAFLSDLPSDHVSGSHGSVLGSATALGRARNGQEEEIEAQFGTCQDGELREKPWTGL